MRDEKWLAMVLLIAQILALITLILLVTGCTYSITMVHTEGQASDVVDEQQSPSTDLKASIPLK